MAVAPSDIAVIVYAPGMPPTLHACLQALVASSPPGGDVMVIVDAEADVTASCDAPVRLLRDPECGSAPATVNATAVLQGRPVLLFLPATLALHADALAKAVEILNRRGDLGAVFAVVEEDAADEQFFPAFEAAVRRHARDATAADDALPFGCDFVVIRRDAFRAAGGFDVSDEDINLVSLAEALRRARRDFVICDEPLAADLLPPTLSSLAYDHLAGRRPPASRGHRIEPPVTHRLSLVLALAVPILSALATLWLPSLGMSLVAFALLMLLNEPLIRSLHASGGFRFAARGTLWLWASLVLSAIGSIVRYPQTLLAPAPYGAGLDDPVSKPRS